MGESREGGLGEARSKWAAVSTAAAGEDVELELVPLQHPPRWQS